MSNLQQEVEAAASSLIRKYDWHVKDLGRLVRLTVNDGAKFASVSITTGEDIEREVKRAVKAVDAHEYGELEG